MWKQLRQAWQGLTDVDLSERQAGLLLAIPIAVLTWLVAVHVSAGPWLSIAYGTALTLGAVPVAERVVRPVLLRIAPSLVPKSLGGPRHQRRP